MHFLVAICAGYKLFSVELSAVFSLKSDVAPFEKVGVFLRQTPLLLKVSLRAFL